MLPLQRTLAFGIPSNSVLEEIISHSPRGIVEMGAGTGFWSSMLLRLGADVVAFDACPIAEYTEENRNEYFKSRSYFPVREGDASSVFCNGSSEVSGRALLLVWPNNPDSQDNKHLLVGEAALPDVWDIECLQRYHNSGGETVIYAGERETKIELMEDATAPDCGFCSSRKFQQFLQEHFDLVAELECPRWWTKEDDVTIWKRK